MNFPVSKAFISLTARTFAIRTPNIIYIYITGKFYAKSSFFGQIMSSSINVGIHSQNVTISEQETQKKEKVDQGIIKSENDSMEYRLIQLDNGLRAILVSDVLKIVDLNALSSADTEESEDESEDGEDEGEESDIVSSSYEDVQNDAGSEDEDREAKPKVREAEEKMAACALCIGVGSFSDPPDIPGLAHFLEHMVFMGSIKYPQENGFDEFIKKHGGSDNGSTECETTTFYLECNEKYLKEGMDRFAQFFISPLMKREAMTREREVIHSEFEMSLPSDSTRREQILGSLAPSGHPASKFLWGNLTTLRTNVDDNVLYERVHEFRKRHYSAHRMTVAVQARLPLDILEEYVRESFSGIPSNGLPCEEYNTFCGTYGTPDSFNKILWVKPVRDICQVHLTWVLPSFMKEYKSRPLDYVAWLIGHEGEGSLLSLLRRRVWALECVAGNDESGFEHNSIYSLFSTSLTLTEEGYKHINEVISLVFSYISMLKISCPDKEIYDELHTICETNFRYKTEVPSASYVEILAESMHLYEPQHYIAGGELYLEYKPRLITEILNLLTPDRVNVIIYSKENPDNFYDRIEPWFQTRHKIEEIPSDWKENWRSAHPRNEFHVPKRNPYLTTDFSLLRAPETNPPYPVKILETNLLELWYRQDTKFKQPLAYFSFYIVSPIIKSDPLNAVLLDVLAAYLETKFMEQIFPANEAGLYCTFFPAELGLFLLFSGYNEKLPLLFDEILRLIQKCCSEISGKNNAELFNAIKKGRSRSYYNRFLKPRKLVKMARMSVLVEHFSTSVEHLNMLDQVTLERLHDFAAQFFGCVKIIGLIQGNVSKDLSLELCQKFETVLLCSPLDGEKPNVRVTKLDPGEIFLRLKSFNEGDSNSVVVNYYQANPGSIRTSCVIDLIMMLMDEPLFDNLRTKQQIGYDVHCLLRDTFGVLAFSVTVFFQSAKFDPDEVDERIEAFLKMFLKTLKSMSKKEWEETKASLILLKSNADLQLQDEVKRNFAEIFSGDYVFDRLQKEFDPFEQRGPDRAAQVAKNVCLWTAASLQMSMAWVDYLKAFDSTSHAKKLPAVDIISDITHKEMCSWFADHIASGKHFKKLSVQVVGESEKAIDSAEKEHTSGKTVELVTMTSEKKKNLFITDLAEYRSRRQFFPAVKKL